MVETAAADVIIVSGGDASMNEFMTRPEIQSVADMRGKTLVADRPDTAYAQSYPRRPVRLVVAVAAGGSTDIMARLVGAKLGERIGQQVAFDNVLILTPYSRNNTLRAIGVTSAKRSVLFPELPTIAETGVPGFHAVGWFGIFSTGRTPQPVVDKLNTALVGIMKEPDMRDRLIAQGAEPLGG